MTATLDSGNIIGIMMDMPSFYYVDTVERITLLDSDGVYTLAKRGILSDKFEPGVRGRDRRFTRENILELLLLRKFSDAGTAMQDAKPVVGKIVQRVGSGKTPKWCFWRPHRGSHAILDDELPTRPGLTADEMLQRVSDHLEAMKAGTKRPEPDRLGAVVFLRVDRLVDWMDAQLAKEKVIPES